MKASTQDTAAAIVSIIIVVGVVILAGIGRPVPDGLDTALGAAMTWLYVRTAHGMGHEVLDPKEVRDGKASRSPVEL